MTFGDRGDITYQASGNVGRIANPSSRKRDDWQSVLQGNNFLPVALQPVISIDMDQVTLSPCYVASFRLQ